MSKTAVMFPGQGSQFVGMGKEFLAADRDAGDLMEMAESVSGFPLRRLCMEGPLAELTRTVHLQPAVTTINLLCWQAVRKSGLAVDYFVGHSLGEYSALSAAGVLIPWDTISLVTERGRLMEREGEKNPGGMMAILGLTFAGVHEVLAALSGRGVVCAANYNSEQQVVISGDAVGLEEAAAAFTGRGAKAVPLQVSVANHSPLVAAAVPDFEKVMAGVSFQPPAVPVLFNVTAEEEAGPAAIRSIMARQIASPVRWYQIINRLADNGVDTFVEVGPGTVLSRMLKRVLPRGTSFRSFQIDSPDKLQALHDKLA